MAMTDEEKRAKKKEYNRKWQAKNKDRIRERRREYYDANKESICAKSQAHHAANIEKGKKVRALYYNNNKEKIAAQSEVYRNANKKEIATSKAKYYAANKNKIAAKAFVYHRTLNGKYAAYKGSAKHRCISFDLKKEQFLSFWQTPCYYCGSPIKTIGLDRMDSDLGYSLDNVVPCCRSCNEKKNTTPFKEYMLKIGKQIP